VRLTVHPERDRPHGPVARDKGGSGPVPMIPDPIPVKAIKGVARPERRNPFGSSWEDGTRVSFARVYKHLTRCGVMTARYSGKRLAIGTTTRGYTLLSRTPRPVLMVRWSDSNSAVATRWHELAVRRNESFQRARCCGYDIVADSPANTVKWHHDGQWQCTLDFASLRDSRSLVGEQLRIVGEEQIP
jgi:hypothetical protein